MEIPVPDSPHFRNLVATLMGLMFCVITVGTMEMIGHAWFPPPDNAEQVAAQQITVEQEQTQAEKSPAASLFFMQASPASLAWVMTGWGLGVLVGCFVAGVLGGEQATFCCLVLCLFCGAMLILVMIETPAPAWFRLISPVSLVVGGLAGWGLSQRLLAYWKTLEVFDPEARQETEE